MRRFADAAAGGPTLSVDASAEVYAEYQRRLLAANAMDFDDLLLVAVQVLQRCEDVRTAYQQRFRHVLVDDTGHEQGAERARHGCSARAPRQRLRGGRLRPVDLPIPRRGHPQHLGLRAFIPRCTVVMLEQNFRSTQTILDAAKRGDRPQLGRRPKRLFTVDDVGHRSGRYRAENEYDEASFVASEIFRLRNAEQLLRDVAIFYRTNAQSRALEEELCARRCSLQGRRRLAFLRPPGDQGHPRLRRGCWPTR